MQFTKLNDGKGQVKVTGLDAQPRYLNRDNYTAKIAPNNTLQIVQNSTNSVVIQNDYSNITQPTSSNLEELCDILNGEGFFDGSKGGGGNGLNSPTRKGNMLVADDSFSWVETNDVSVVSVDPNLFGGAPTDEVKIMGFSLTPLPLTPPLPQPPTTASLQTINLASVNFHSDTYLIKLSTTQHSSTRYVNPDNEYVLLELKSNDGATGFPDFQLASYSGGNILSGIRIVNDFNQFQLYAGGVKQIELTDEGTIFSNAIKIGELAPSAGNPLAPQGDGTVSFNSVTTDLEVEIAGEQKSLTGKKTIQNASSGTTAITKDTDLVFITTTGTAATLNLPAGSTVETGKEIKFIDTGNANNTTDTISIVPNGTDNINGANSAVDITSAYGFVILIWDGSQWINIS